MSDPISLWFPLAAAVGALAFGLFLLVSGFRKRSQAGLLKRRGAPGKARVLRRYEERVNERSEDRRPGRPTRFRQYIDYELTVHGQSYQSRRIVPPSDLWETLLEGDEVEVLYLPGRPEVSQLAAQSTEVKAVGGDIQMAIGALATASSAAFLLTGAVGAFADPAWPTPGPDWVQEEATVAWISRSDDPFVRLLRPNHREVRLVIGQEGRVIPGDVRVLLAPEIWQDLTIDEGIPVLHHPEDRNQAVWERVLR